MKENANEKARICPQINIYICHVCKRQLNNKSVMYELKRKQSIISVIRLKERNKAKKKKNFF